MGVLEADWTSIAKSNDFLTEIDVDIILETGLGTGAISFVMLSRPLPVWEGLL